MSATGNESVKLSQLKMFSDSMGGQYKAPLLRK